MTRDLPVLVIGLAPHRDRDRALPRRRGRTACARSTAGTARSSGARSSSPRGRRRPARRATIPQLLDGIDARRAEPGRAARWRRCSRRRSPRGIPIASEIEIAARHLDVPARSPSPARTARARPTTLLGAMLAQRRPARRSSAATSARRSSTRASAATTRSAVAEVSSFQLEWVDRFRPRGRRLPEPHRRPPRPLRRSRRLRPRPKLAIFAAPDRRTTTAVLNGGDPWLRRHARDFRRAHGLVRRRRRGGDPRRRGGDPPPPRRGEEVYPLRARAGRRAQPREHDGRDRGGAARSGVPPARAGGARGLSRARAPSRARSRAERGALGERLEGTNAGAVINHSRAIPGTSSSSPGASRRAATTACCAAWCERKVKHLVLFGEARDMLARTLAARPRSRIVDIARGRRVRRRGRAATSGDVELLSPACASFDMFRDYA